MFTYYLIYYLIFAFLGWVLDSSYSSFIRNKLTFSGAIKGLPFCYIYGLGGLILLGVFNLSYPLYLKVILGTIAVTSLEYFGGIFCEHVLKERMWDYRHIKFNVQGHISLIHTLYWFTISLAFAVSLYSTFVKFDTYLKSVLEIASTTNKVLIIGAIVIVPTVMYYRFRKNYLKQESGFI